MYTKFLLTLALVAGIFFGSYSLAAAVSTFAVQQGGTGTTTAPTGQLIYGGNSSLTPDGKAYFSVPTTTVSCSGSTSCTSFTIIGASPITITGSGSGSSGISTSSPVSAGNVLVYSATGSGSAFGVATGTVSNGTGISITAGQSIIGSGLTITNTSPLSGLIANYPFSFSNPTLTWIGLSTTTNNTWAGTQTFTNTPVFSTLGAGTVNSLTNGTIYSTATTSLLSGTGITITAGDGALIGGTNATVGLASMIAGVLGTPVTGVPTSQATSSLYGTGTGGQVLGWNNNTGGLAFVATSSTGGGSGTVGSGTTGQFPFYNTSGTTLTATSSITVAQTGAIQIGIQGSQLAMPTNGYLTIGTSTSGNGGVDALYVVRNDPSDAEITLNNQTSGKGSYFRAQGNSNFVSFEQVGTGGADWKEGMFGSTDFNISDNGTNIVNINKGSPSGLLQLSSTGRVGIATTSPSFTESVQGSRYTSGPSFFGGAILATSTLTVTGTATSSIAGTTLIKGRILQIGSGTNYVPSGGSTPSYLIIDRADNTQDSSLLIGTNGKLNWEIGQPGDQDLHFKSITGTEAGGYTFTDRMFLASTSQIGFGTSVPTGQWEFASTSPQQRPQLTITNKSVSGTSGVQIALYGQNSGNVSYLGTDAGQNGGNNLFLNVGGNFGTGLFVDSNNNVGIGTTSLFATLSVNPIAGKAANQFAVGSSTGTAFLINNSGNVGVGSTTPTAKLAVQGTMAAVLTAFATGDGAVCQRGAGGLLTFDSGVTSCTTSSEYVKYPEGTDDYESAVARIKKLNVVLFAYKENGKQDIGLYAEDVAKIDGRYAQYAGTDRDMSGHHFKKGDPVAINWTAIQADMILVIQHQISLPEEAGYITESAQDKWQDILICLFVFYVIYNEKDKRRRKEYT